MRIGPPLSHGQRTVRLARSESGGRFDKATPCTNVWGGWHTIDAQNPEPGLRINAAGATCGDATTAPAIVTGRQSAFRKWGRCPQARVFGAARPSRAPGSE